MGYRNCVNRTRVVVEEFEYGVILRDATGEYAPDGIRHFPESLEVGMLITHLGSDGVVDSINEKITPPIVCLAPA
jgi:hypothetical protein